MKLILTAEVDHLGSSGDIVEVKDGYGRNFLLPRGLAIVASRGAERQAEEIRRAREIKSVKGLEHANELKTAIEGLGPVELSVKAAADTGKLFGSVTAADVVAAIKKAGGPNLDKRTVRLPKAHIKSVGTHPIAVRLQPGRGRFGVLERRRDVITPARIRPGEDHDQSSPGRCCIRWRTSGRERLTAKLTSC